VVATLSCGFRKLSESKQRCVESRTQNLCVRGAQRVLMSLKPAELCYFFDTGAFWEGRRTGAWEAFSRTRISATGSSRTPNWPSWEAGFTLSAIELEALSTLPRLAVANSDQGIGQRDQQVPGSVAVDIGVSSSEITQCLLDPVRARFQEEPLMSGAPAGDSNGEAHFGRFR